MSYDRGPQAVRKTSALQDIFVERYVNVPVYGITFKFLEKGQIE